AGDDVDVCWRLQERGWKLGFHPAAVVWHHRRNSVRTYWRQQIGYGRAEAMLERKWPEKYNGPGHVRWAGRLYGDGLTHALGGRLNEGLTPWRHRGIAGPTPLWPVTASLWTDQAGEQDQRLRTLEADLRAEGACVLRGGRHAPWDLGVRGGFFGSARLILAVED